MVVALAKIHGEPSYLEPILRSALNGLRTPPDVERAREE